MRLGLNLSLSGLRNLGGEVAFTPASLFASGEEGAWYEPSPSTCFTATWTGSEFTDITAASVGDPVAIMNDLSGNGNHATQTSFPERPYLRQTGGGLYYLEFDGTDDVMETAAIDFSVTDKMSVFAGLEKESDASTALLCEFSISTGSENGSFFLGAPTSSGTNRFTYLSKGTDADSALTTSSTFDAPVSVVATGLSDISAPQVSLRLNGSLVDTSMSTQGTGNYGNHAFYIGARAATSLFFDGKLFNLIVRGATTSGDDLANAESYVADKTGVTL